MLYKYPEYYKQFKCIGGRCEATCCAGWEIVIDEESIEKYDDVSGDFGKRLRNSINYQEEVFFQDKEKRCAFLNPENLCDIYTNVGEEYLCHTCTNYPRHLEEFEDMNEMSLSISCPEVARLILDRVEPVSFYEEEEEEEAEEYEDFDFMFFDMLCGIRDYAIKILQDRTVEQRVGVEHLLRLISDVQEAIIEANVFDIDEIVEEYAKGWEEKVDAQELPQYDFNLRQDIMEEYMEHLSELETLYEDWPDRRESYMEVLYDDGDFDYAKSYQEFHASCNIEIELEQLLVYFLYSYFCGSVYDGDALAKFQIAYINTSVIEEMWFAHWLMNGKELDRKEIHRITYSYAREIEHSDMNLDTLEEIYSVKDCYELDGMLKVLGIES